jgi:sRNA-binding carbon storage regulator CsrA
MLALICRVGQSLQIGPDIRLTVQARQGARVAIGIEAPPGAVVPPGFAVLRLLRRPRRYA